MKKNIVLSMTVLSAVAAMGSTPLTSYAAEAETSKITSDKCYKVYVGQGIGSLSETLKQLGITFGNNGNLCPDVEKPGVVYPGAGNPDTQKPDTENTDTQKPDTENTDTQKPDDQKPDTDITAAANVRAKEIVQKFSHTRPNGSSFGTVLKEQGVSFRGSGENIAWGQKSPEQVMNGWMNSEGHRANILNKNYKNIGVGYYQNEKGVNYWVQLFTY